MTESPSQLRLVEYDDTFAPPAPSSKPRPRNVVWDAMEALFGPVAPGTSAFGARTRSVKDLKLMEATPDEIRRAKAAYHKAFPGAACTDLAIAKHFPLFRPRQIMAPCPECGVGGGTHSAECPSVT